ncbi:MAG TPA: hypothetical protein VFU41_01060, partial [Gemmatimonadales bacterium]|nr:hypothetical protein [Gemmatimonadales bacterium]
MSVAAIKAVVVLRLCAVAVLLLALASCGGRREPTGVRVGLITPGSIADAAWNSEAYRGLLQIR